MFILVLTWVSLGRTFTLNTYFDTMEQCRAAQRAYVERPHDERATIEITATCIPADGVRTRHA